MTKESVAMIDQGLREKMDTAIWIGRSLFQRGLVTGSTSNMSFLHEGRMYITASGSCFGRLAYENFAAVEMDGTCRGRKPSKEFPMHLALYRKNPENGAVIHTHSMYATLWACMKDIEAKADRLYAYTPYLGMLSNGLVTVPYAPPGTEDLFRFFEERAGKERAYLLMNHGPVTSGSSLMKAFYLIEELEASAKISWMLREEEATPFMDR